jgi:hypothetical protein
MTSRAAIQRFDRQPGSWYLHVSAESASQIGLASSVSALKLSGSSSIVLGYLKQRPSEGVLDEMQEREAFPVHSWCLTLFRALLGRSRTFDNVVAFIWTIARSMCGAWAVRRRAESRLQRQSAVLRDAVRKGHFSNLYWASDSHGPSLADILGRVDLLPAELQVIILENCAQGPFVDCLVAMQQILDFAPLLHLAEASNFTTITTTHDLHFQKCRIAGRDYVLQVGPRSFEEAAVVRIVKPEDSIYLMLEFDDFGITSLQYVTRTQRLGTGIRKAVSPGTLWYHFLELGEGTAAMLILERKVRRFPSSSPPIIVSVDFVHPISSMQRS